MQLNDKRECRVGLYFVNFEQDQGLRSYESRATYSENFFGKYKTAIQIRQNVEI